MSTIFTRLYVQFGHLALNKATNIEKTKVNREKEKFILSLLPAGFRFNEKQG